MKDAKQFTDDAIARERAKLNRGPDAGKLAIIALVFLVTGSLLGFTVTTLYHRTCTTTCVDWPDARAFAG